MLAVKETSLVQVAHHQVVARQRQKLIADFGVTMHLAWTRHMLDNREFVVNGGTQPNTEPGRDGGLDGTAAAKEHVNYHQDAYMNDKNHASSAPPTRCFGASPPIGTTPNPACLAYDRLRCRAPIPR